jgi:hypothetical protein
MSYFTRRGISQKVYKSNMSLLCLLYYLPDHMFHPFDHFLGHSRSSTYRHPAVTTMRSRQREATQFPSGAYNASKQHPHTAVKCHLATPSYPPQQLFAQLLFPAAAPLPQHHAAPAVCPNRKEGNATSLPQKSQDIARAALWAPVRARL